MIRFPGFSRKRPEAEEPPIEVIKPNESFAERFSRRKTEARQQALAETEEAATPASDEPEVPELTDADMPPIESLDFDSDFTGFMSPKVSDALRRQALKKLFLSPEFNIVDGLDEYAEDYTTFEALGNIVTADMKHQIEMEAKRKAEEAEKALAEEGTEDEAPAAEQLAEADQTAEIEAAETETAAQETSFDDVEDDWDDEVEDV